MVCWCNRSLLRYDWSVLQSNPSQRSPALRQRSVSFVGPPLKADRWVDPQGHDQDLWRCHQLQRSRHFKSGSRINDKYSKESRASYPVRGVLFVLSSNRHNISEALRQRQRRCRQRRCRRWPCCFHLQTVGDWSRYLYSYQTISFW